MKLLHIVNGNDNGGATTQVATLIKAQKQHYEVEVLCLNYGKIVEKMQQLNIKYKMMDFSFLNISKLLKFVSEKATQGFVIHAHGLKPMILLQKFMKHPSYDRKKMKLVATIHSNYHKEYSKKKFIKLFAIPTFIKVCKAIDVIIVVSEEFKNILIADGVSADKIHYIENGISMDHVVYDTDRFEFLKKRGVDLSDFPSDLIVYGLVARIHPVKGIDILIDAANRLEGNFLVLIAGSGEQSLLESYVKRIEMLGLGKKIKFLGYIDEISKFYQCIDVNLICSYSEALSYSVLEGAYYKKPLVCTKVLGLVKVLEEGKEALMSEIGDAFGLADNMKFSIENREHMAVLGQNLHDKISRIYNSQKMFEKYDFAYQVDKK